MFDTHAHLADTRFEEDRAEVIERALEAGVKELVCVCSNPEEIEVFSRALSHYPFIWLAAGVHPHDASKYENLKGMLEEALKIDKFCALGEIGLDYHYMNSPKESQKNTFRDQLKFAKERNLPVIIHSREAHWDTYQILKDEKVKWVVMHCFSGTERELKEYLDMGFYISLAGPVTFPRAFNLRALAKIIPLDRLLVETDSPYLAPQKMRGKRNEPAFLRYTLEEIARIRQIPLDELGKITHQNAREFFKISRK